MIYIREFFDLQFEFAHRAAAISGLPLPRALLEYTNFYIRFGLGHAFDDDHPVWKAYVDGLQDRSDHRLWTYKFFLRQSPVVVPPNLVATFGCFSYSRLGSDRVRLHFENAETDGRSPLAFDRQAQRVEDLSAVFAHVKRTVPGPLHVVGASWLYNLDAYRRLFPPSYIATAQTLRHRFQHMPLWGQFLNRRGEIRESMRDQFLECVERQSSLESLDQCFPFQPLRLEAPVEEFYKHYKI